MRTRTKLFAALLSVAAIGATSDTSWYQVVGGAFLVDPTTLTALQRNFERLVLERARSDHLKMLPFSRYRFQFRGEADSDRRSIFVLGFCDDLGRRNLTQYFLPTMDHGICFFLATYDPDTGQLRDLMVEGTA